MEQLVTTFLTSSDLASPYLNLQSNEVEIFDYEKNSPSITEIHDHLLIDLNEQSLKSDETKQKNKNKKKNRKRCEFHLKKKRKIRKGQDWENHQSFTFFEDQKILNLVLELGPKFAEVSKHFADRSLNAIKNRYYKYLRFRWNTVLGSEYKYMNHRQEETSVQVNDLLALVDQLNFFPEATNLLQKFVMKIESCLS